MQPKVEDKFTQQSICIIFEVLDISKFTYVQNQKITLNITVIVLDISKFTYVQNLDTDVNNWTKVLDISKFTYVQNQ